MKGKMHKNISKTRLKHCPFRRWLSTPPCNPCLVVPCREFTPLLVNTQIFIPLFMASDSFHCTWVHRIMATVFFFTFFYSHMYFLCYVNPNWMCKWNVFWSYGHQYDFYRWMHFVHAIFRFCMEGQRVNDYCVSGWGAPSPSRPVPAMRRCHDQRASRPPSFAWLHARGSMCVG